MQTQKFKCMFVAQGVQETCQVILMILENRLTHLGKGGINAKNNG